MAKLWRSPCGLIRTGSIPASAAYFFTSAQNCWRLSGCSDGSRNIGTEPSAPAGTARLPASSGRDCAK
ncbi:hypothetical protein D9M71_843000 [compost metagenome]